MFLFIGIGLRCRGVNLIANQSFDSAFQNSLDSKTEMAENSLTGNGIQPSAAAGGCPPVMSWFVMRVTYSREMKAQALLQSAGIECFVPMRTDRSGAEEKQVPAVHNFILSGPFLGVQGRVLRVRKDRKVALQLAGVVAVAVSGIPVSDLKIIENLQGL